MTQPSPGNAPLPPQAPTRSPEEVRLDEAMAQIGDLEAERDRLADQERERQQYIEREDAPERAAQLAGDALLMAEAASRTLLYPEGSTGLVRFAGTNLRSYAPKGERPAGPSDIVVGVDTPLGTEVASLYSKIHSDRNSETGIRKLHMAGTGAELSQRQPFFARGIERGVRHERTRRGHRRDEIVRFFAEREEGLQERSGARVLGEKLTGRYQYRAERREPGMRRGDAYATAADYLAQKIRYARGNGDEDMARPRTAQEILLDIGHPHFGRYDINNQLSILTKVEQLRTGLIQEIKTNLEDSRDSLLTPAERAQAQRDYADNAARLLEVSAHRAALNGAMSPDELARLRDQELVHETTLRDQVGRRQESMPSADRLGREMMLQRDMLAIEDYYHHTEIVVDPSTGQYITDPATGRPQRRILGPKTEAERRGAMPVDQFKITERKMQAMRQRLDQYRGSLPPTDLVAARMQLQETTDKINLLTGYLSRAAQNTEALNAEARGVADILNAGVRSVDPHHGLREARLAGPVIEQQRQDVDADLQQLYAERAMLEAAIQAQQTSTP